MEMEKILIVDDLEEQCRKYARIAQDAIGECQIFTANNGKEALKTAREHRDISLVILDVNFDTLPADELLGPDPNREGFIIAHHLRALNPDLQVVLTTCFDELEEPFVIRLEDTPSDIRQKIKLAMHVAQLERENKELRRLHYAVNTDEGTIVGNSESLMRVLSQTQKAALGHDREPILILGESGTGKELLAKFIHRHSSRKHKPMITINCASLSKELIENELFGHEKEAFTGAVSRMTGRLEAADGGMLFLDEIGDMCLEMQAKLLRVLEHRGFERVGSSKTINPDVRFIFATNKDLPAEIEAGRFRQDLYSRLGALHLKLPPLRERKEDIPVLVTYFLDGFTKAGKKPKAISPELMRLFVNYDWPGNVRELQSKVRAAAILSQNEVLEIAALPETIKTELQVCDSRHQEFESIDKELSRFPESDKKQLLQLFMLTEGTVTRQEIKAVLGLGDAATNERIQMFKMLGLIRMDSRKYRKTELLESYWTYVSR